MADDKTKTGGRDRQRINVHEAYELREWSQSFGVTPSELIEAVEAVGDEASRVREFLVQTGKAVAKQ